MATYKSSNEQALWISALTNRTAISALMIDRQANRQSPFIMIDRIADIRFNIPEGRRSTSFQPVYNPQDKSEWPELLGWLVTVGEMVEVCPDCGGDCDSILKAMQKSLAQA